MGKQPDESGSSLFDDDPNLAFVKVKMRITDLTGPRRRASEIVDNAELQRLKLRLEEIRKDYLFDQEQLKLQIFAPIVAPVSVWVCGRRTWIADWVLISNKWPTNFVLSYHRSLV